MKIAVSACLLGDNVRYDGTNKFNEVLVSLLEGHEIIRICPEAMVFLIPHLPIEIQDGRITDSDGFDHTQDMTIACEKCLAQIEGCDFVILKSKSPSCGYGEIYDGTFSGTIIKGNGLFATLCLENGYRIFTENDLEEIRQILI
ncbi:MAG: DUF523 domain-containing protein [Erysipelotrichaceae bacterium]|nr:DUF523 domain-containing protein [Erysipelotrichaceae bacterium]